MTNTTAARLLEVARKRNGDIATAYKTASRRLLSRPMSTMAAAAADQRKELGEELAAMEADLPEGIASMQLELPEELVEAAIRPIPETDDALALFAFFRDIETAEREIYTLMASKFTAADPDLSSRLSAIAEQARKRSALAGDHLDLLSLGGGRP